MTRHDSDTGRPSSASSTPGAGEPVPGNRPTGITPLFEERFHEIFRTTSAGMVLGAPDGSFMEANPAFCRFLGYTEDELLTLSVEKITHPDDREMSREKRNAALTGISSSYAYEKRYLRKDGSTVWGQLSSNWFYDADGKPAYGVGIIQDITDRKRMEQTLRESEAKFAAAFHGTPTWLVISTLPDGRFIEINDAFERICGYRREEVIGRTALELDLWEQREDRARVVDIIRREERVRNLEVNFRGKGGAAFVGLLSADLIDIGGERCLLTLVNDITARKRAEEALLESEEKFSKAFRSAPCQLAITTLANGRFIEVNEVFERVFGYSAAEVIGRTSLELKIWQYPQDRQRMVSILRSEGRVRAEEVRFRQKGGGTIVGVYSAELLQLGGETCVLSLVSDVTARKRLEGEIEILHTDLACRAAELESANRELETFSHTVSHDLRAPLTGIAGYAELLREQCGSRLDEQCRGYVEQIIAAGERMDQLITALLNLSRLTRAELRQESVDLSGLALEIAVELRLEAPERGVEFRIAPEVTVVGDMRLLRIVLQNLIGNAWKYTSGRDEAVIEFGMTQADGGPVCFVRDNGAGFDMALAPRLFGPFQRLHTEKEFAGHGIGLATVERIIRRHGGRVWGEGAPGEGACFYFTIPGCGA